MGSRITGNTKQVQSRSHATSPLEYYGRKQERPGTGARAKKSVVRLAGNLLSRRADLVKLGRRSFVFGEHNIDHRVGRNGNYNATVDIEAHYLGVARRADILGQPFT